MGVRLWLKYRKVWKTFVQETYVMNFWRFLASEIKLKKSYTAFRVKSTNVNDVVLLWCVWIWIDQIGSKRQTFASNSLNNKMFSQSQEELSYLWKCGGQQNTLEEQDQRRQSFKKSRSKSKTYCRYYCHYYYINVRRKFSYQEAEVNLQIMVVS